MVTFLVNDILKHQAILLGNAEQPKKKKRSLWNTLKKKDISSSRLSKKHSNDKNISDVFNVSQKSGKLRSPLQACENLVVSEDCSFLGSSSLKTEKHKLPVSPVSPELEKSPSEFGTPLSICQSTTYTLLHAPVNSELLNEAQDTNLLKEFHLNEDVISKNTHNTVTKSVQQNVVKGHLDFSDIKLPVFTPDHPSTLHIPHQKTYISPDSFVSDNYLANKDLKSMAILSPEQFMKDDSKDTHTYTFESQRACDIYKPFFQRTILSPDSFVNDSYEQNEDLELLSVDPILSPDQFVKNNMHASQETTDFSQLPSPNAPILKTSLNWKFGSEDQTFPNGILKETRLVEIKLNYSSPSNEDHHKVPAVQKNPSYNVKEQRKRRPILSTTVTKNKPECSERKRIGTNNPKSKRCLTSAITDCENTEIFHASLPTIHPVVNESKSCKDGKVNSFSFGNTFVGHKRKSEGNFEEINAVDSTNEHMEVRETKRIHYSCTKSRTLTVVKTKKAIIRSPASKHVNIREKQNRKKKIDSLGYGPSGFVINKVNKPAVAVAQSHLTFIKPLKTAIPRHPLPFAARNMFYDERWKEKQEQGFTWWLNFILTPDDLTVKAKTSQVNAVSLLLGENHYKASVPRAPTKDEMSLRAYTARCRLNRLRRKACHLFTSEKMVKAIKKLEAEIETRRLLVRKDKHLWKDVGERQKILNWLLSYNPLWLRIGLETVYGELISLENNSDVAGLAIFILNRLLWNPDIAAEYRHPSVPHLYGEGHEEALSRFTLKKLLLLVCFLDHAKLSRLIDHDPCLFCKDAEFKASKEILLAFSRDFLSGEGDLSRHLGFLGLPVSHIQTPLDEFDFAVTNLAVDLKCGIRLVRAMELLTKNWNLSNKLRIPAISRLQKINNVDIVLQVLNEYGVPLNNEQGRPIQSKDIVDSHRERTLALLWKIALTFQVDILLNLDQLKEEIVFLKHSLNIKRKINALSSYNNGLTYVKKNRRSSFSLEHHSENVRLLMDWVNAVCAFYSNRVENFTVSFSDGRVLCYLIHHYHPCYVPFEAICQRTTQTVEYAKTDSVALNSSSESDGSSLDICFGAFNNATNSSVIYKELLDNEKKNFHLISTAVRDLGGIPAMIHHADMSNTIPDERVVITYLSFLCARLLDLRKETRAARVIQTSWRKYKIRTNIKLYQEKDKAARIIQAAVIKFLARKQRKKLFNATVIIQKYWRRYLAWRKMLMLRKAKLEKIQNKSAVVIQAFWRRYSIRKWFLKLKYCAIILQARIRMLVAIAAFKQHRWAAITIQRHWRACLRRREDQQKYKILKSSSLVIQSAFRRWKRRKLELQTKSILVLQRAFRKWKVRKLAKEEKAAVIIQSWYRMQKEKTRYTHIRLSVIIIQSRFRCKQTRKLYIEKKKCILTIQKHYRAYQKGRTERTNYLQKRRAVIQLQSAFRGMKVRQLCRKIRAAWVIQSHYRAYILRKKFLRVKHAIITLQAFIKMKQAHKQYLTLRKSALCIQRWYRSRRYAAQCRDEYQLLRKSSIKLQAVVRGHLVRKQICLQRKAATVLQSYFRMRKEQQHYLCIYRATVCIQSHYRAYQLQIHEREKFLEIKKSVVCLQAAYRGYKIRKMFNQKHAAALKIQTAFRGHTKRLKYQAILKSSIKIQQWYRAHKAGYEIRMNFLKTRAAVIFLQSVYRGWKVRKWVQREHNAAIIIQCAFRRVRAQKKFRLMKNAALMIQQHFKTKILEKKQHKAYTDDLYHAVLSLQAVWRGRAIRRQINRQNQSAVIIQSCFRMYICQKKWKAMRRAALRIQRYYKAYNTGKKQYSLYLKIKSATLILQSAYRGMKVRKQMKALHKAAITIQAKYKSYSARKKYLSLQAAAITIQRQYRALVKANHQRWEYLILRNITIKMQAIYKGVQVRRQIHHMHRAATYIKAVFKMYQLRTKYRTMRMAAIVIQVRYRAYRQGKVQRDNYLTLLQATIILQAAFRGAGIRQKLRKMKVAATVIQSHYQKYSQHKYLSELDKGTKPLQQQHCAIKEGSIQVDKYSDLNHSVVCIQAAFRGMKARQHLRLMQLAATLIQRRFRSSIIRKRYLSLKRATILIQRKYRATVWAKSEFQEYLYLRKAVIVLQSHYRCFMVKKKVKEMHQAATVIQTAFRRHRAYASYQTMKNTIIISQQHSFVYREGKLQMENYLKQQNSAMVIQAAYRGMKSRQLLQKKHNAAVIIQSSYRMYKQYCYYRDIQWATKVIQRRYRVNKEKKEAFQHSFIMKKEATCLQETLGATTTTNERQDPYQALVGDQNHIKVHQSNLTPREAEVIQKTHRASIKTCVPTKGLTYIEPTYKDLKLQRNFLHMHQSATLIQATFRMYKARAAYRTMRNAAVVIQTYYRLYSKTKTDQNTFLKTRKAILTIQAAFRGMKARQKFKNMLEREMAAIVIQSAFRHYRTKIRLKIAQDTSAVFQSWQKSCQRTPLQKMAWPQRTTEKTTDTFHKTITRNLGKQNNDGQRIRPFLHMAMYRRKFLQQIRSALILHAYMRWQTKRQFILYKKAALILEDHYRTYLSSRYQRKVHLQTQYSIIRIQARVKGFIQRRKFQKIKDSTIKIQAVWRGYKARQFLRKVRAAKKIQACFRCYKARKEYLALKKAVYIIQNLFYTRLQRIWFLNLRLSTIIIQRRWRTTVVAKKTRERFLCMREATIKIQSAYRGYCVRNQMLKRHFQAREQQNIHIQNCQNIKGQEAAQECWIRRNRAAAVIQRAARNFLLHRREEKLKSGISKIQALWRGYSWRKKNDFSEIKAIRLSLQEANRKSREENKLYKRTALAIHYLLTYKHLSYILEALKHLEVVTRLSPLCCENMAQSGAIAKIFVLILNCNRSIPCMEVITYAVQVLLNVAKYEKTAPSVYEVENCIDTLLYLLQTYREKSGDKVADKGGSIFTKTCCLLAILLKTSRRASDIRSRPKIVNRLCSLYKLTAHKHKICTERIITKQKMKPTNGHCFIPPTPIRTKVVSRLKPDWVLRKDNMQEIVNPLQAIQMVMDTLGIPY